MAWTRLLASGLDKDLDDLKVLIELPTQNWIMNNALIVSFIVPDPRCALGALLDVCVADTLGDRGSQKLLPDGRLGAWGLADAVVLDQELKCLWYVLTKKYLTSMPAPSKTP